MRKFLKVFSVIAILYCCMFSFVGCDIFKEVDKTENEYAQLIAERKIVREVVNNTKAMLTSNTEQVQEPLAQSSEIIAQNGQNEAELILTWCTEDLQLFVTSVNAVTNSVDFVPGKLYNAKIEEVEDGVTYGCYLLMNAYCNGENMVTLNIWQAYNKDVGYYYDTVFVSIDIFYNENYKPIETIEYHHEYEDGNEFPGYEGRVLESLGTHEVTYSSNGEAITYIGATTDIYGERQVQVVDENGYTELDIVGEIETNFNNAMIEIRERTYLFNFARPLNQVDQDKIFNEF